MTCRELHWYFADQPLAAELRSDCGVIAEHVAACAECGRFVEEHREVRKNLRLIRDSVAGVPESVDEAIFANYRAYMAGQRGSVPVIRARRAHSTLVLGWSVVALVALAVLFLSGHRRVMPGVQVATEGPVGKSPTVSAQKQVAGALRTPKRRVTTAKDVRHAASDRHPERERPGRALPDGFRSLMYCDELSCAGGMDMIRIQLPSSVMPRDASGFLRTSGSVTADVLVGPDGVARGIRFEEIEF